MPLWLLLSACSVRSCHGCGGDALAVLVERVGEVQRDHAAQVGHFTSALPGERFQSGDGLRTLPNARARLQLRASGSVLVQSDTTIRLWRGQARGLRMKVQTGDARVVAESTALEIQTEVGLAILQAGSQMRVRPAHKGQRYEVTVGRAMLATPDGRQVTLGAGEVIGVDKAADAQQVEGQVAAAVAGADAGAPEAPGNALAQGDAPSDLRLLPGASAAIYDPKPPSAVSLDVPSACDRGALLTLKRQRAMKLTQPETLLLSTGTHDYQLACLGPDGQPGPISWRGTIRVLHNPGTAQLPRSAPRNSIDCDGRTYTILFQNLLPVLEVRWPHPPAAARYRLSVQLAGGRELHFDLARAQYVFRPGALPEGRHVLHFEADAPGNPRSRPTTIELHFDNASPSASLRSPPARGFPPGATVHVAGIALPGAQVSVLGQPLALDAQQRFSGDVALPPGTASIAVRIQHSRTGTRYYIRRASDTRASGARARQSP